MPGGQRWHWTPAEDACLRDLWAERLSSIEIARRMRCNVNRIYNRALRLGLRAPRPYTRYGFRFEARLREFHGRGYSDADIAAALGGCAQKVGELRRRLGLPSNHHNRRHLSKLPQLYHRGGRHGCALRRWRPLGTVTCRQFRRIANSHRGGRRHTYRQRWIKVRDDGPPDRRWIALANFLYRRHVGPIRPGELIVHRNGDTLDDSLSNLMPISRRDLLSWQRSVRPKMEARRIAAVNSATHKRWADYRQISSGRRAIR